MENFTERTGNLIQVVEVKVVLARQAGRPSSSNRISECLIGDQTGVVIFTARNDQGTHSIQTSQMLDGYVAIELAKLMVAPADRCLMAVCMFSFSGT